jgi:23S rRNA (adenine2030-N6)-methyltransferase
MLSYRHAFHAGNHADLFKHAVFVALLRHLLKKDKAFWCIDTHAGAAQYSLVGDWALKNAEFESGISRLWGMKVLPPLLADYLELVRAFNHTAELRYYPGSPQLAVQLLRRKDALHLFELHSTEGDLLEKHFRSGDAKSRARVEVHKGDGFTGLLSVLPPPSRRGVVLIDPSYEDKQDYKRVVTALREGVKRFATGTFMVWYPQVQRREAAMLPDTLMNLQRTDWLHATLTVKAPSAGGLGLHGSGVFIVNPPWTLPAMLKESLPWLVKTLGQDGEAAFSLDYRMA